MASAAATTLFGGSASQTTPPSQGTIMLFTDPSCSSPLANNPTPLLYGDCFDVPLPGIKGISVSSFPSCPDYGTPLLLVSNVESCGNSTQGTGADSGITGKCQSFSSGVDVKSAEFACFGRGISAAPSTMMTATAAATTSQAAEAPTTTVTTTESNNDDDDSCCCICTVM